MGNFEKQPVEKPAKKAKPITPFVRKLRKINIPAWVFVLFIVVYDELLLHFMTRAIKPETQPAASFTRFIVILLFALAAGLFFGIFSFIGGNAKINRIVALVVTSVISFAVLLEYFIYASFFNYMWLGAGAGAAANVAENADFRHSVYVLVGKGVWRIVLVVLPVVLYGIWGHKGNWGRTDGIPHRVIVIFGCVFCLFLGCLTVGASPDSSFYDEDYEFTSAAKSFGLVTAIRLELFGDHTQKIDASAGQNAQSVLDAYKTDKGKTDKTDKPAAPAKPAQPADPAKPAETEAAQPAEPGAPVETEPGLPAVTESPAATEPAGPGIELPGIGIVPEETEPQETERVLGEHDMGIDFGSLSSSSDDIQAANDYLATLSPTPENEYTGLFAGKNLIFITAEAFAAEIIDPEVTPTLYRLANNGIKFTDYYQPAWGGSTSTGEFSNMTGIVPTDGVNSIQKTIGHNMCMTIGNLLKDSGYYTAAYHNGEYDYYDRDKTHTNLGYASFMGLGNGMENGVKKMWPESDLEMIDYTVPMYIDHRPFSVYYMSISGHCLYSRTGNNMSVRNYDRVAGMLEQYSETVKCYYAANYELEKALTRLLARLEKEGIMDDTVIVLGTDHYPYGLEKSDTWGNSQDYLAELYGYPADSDFAQDHSALIIWSGCIEDMHLQVDDPVFSLDIVPTLANLFGVKYDSRLYAGRDVFSDEMPLVFWLDGSWKTDLGRYNAKNGSFKLSDYAEQNGISVGQEYLEAVRTVIQNKRKFSNVVINKDYYGYLFD